MKWTRVPRIRRAPGRGACEITRPRRLAACFDRTRPTRQFARRIRARAVTPRSPFSLGTRQIFRFAVAGGGGGAGGPGGGGGGGSAEGVQIGARRRPGCLQTVDGASTRRCVHAAARVFAERVEVADAEAELTVVRRGRRLEDGRPERRGERVPVDVPAGQGGQAWVAHYITARDRLAAGVSVLVHGRRVVGRAGTAVRRVVAGLVLPLEALPAEVGAAAGACARRNEVDLLPGVLPNVGDGEVARRPIEREAPGIAQAVRPDLRPCTGLPDEGVRRRNRVGPAARAKPRIDAQELSEQDVQVLRVRRRIVGAAAVAGADVQVAVRPELELAAVVVVLGVRDLENDTLRRLGDVGVRGSPVLGDDQVTEPSLSGHRVGGVVDVEASARRVVRSEGHREQAALIIAGPHRAADVEERRRELAAGLDDHDAAALLDDEDPLAVSGRRRDEDRRCERGDRLELGLAGRGTACRGEADEERDDGAGPCKGSREPGHGERLRGRQADVSTRRAGELRAGDPAI